MSGHILIMSRSTLVFAFLAGFALPAAAATDARVSESYGKLPLQFEANRGRTHQDVRFLSRGDGYSLYLTSGEAVLVLSKKRDAQASAKSVALRMSLVGAARNPAVSGLDELPGKANYFIGKDPSKWRTNVPTYAKVQYQNVYPGIDLVYYGNQRQLEYDFVVAPSADPNGIVLGFKGADKLEIDAKGELVLHTKGGDIRQHKPVVYQEIDGSRKEIDGRYLIKGRNRVGFRLAAYDRGRPLIIDPVLAYSSYLGGSKNETAGGIAVDADGNAYVTGGTVSTDFPTTPGAFQTAFGGASNDGIRILGDVFVTKINAGGTALIYSTYLGGRFGEQGNAIAIDAAGNAYVTGETLSSNFPVTANALKTTNTNSFRGTAFVAKLDPTGSALVYSTYLGGSNAEGGFGIAADGVGNAYVTGTTRSPDFPVTTGAFQPTFSSPFPNGSDAFVAKVNPDGTALVYSTYLGGSNNEAGGGIALDSGGNAFVAGTTLSADFPVTPGVVHPGFGGGQDIFISKLNPDGSGLLYSTYLSGTPTFGGGIAVDAAGNAYVTGTAGPNFPTTPGAFQPTSAGGPEAFVTKLDPAGAAMVYSTYLGGAGHDSGRGIAVDAKGNAYVTGSTDSTNFPTTEEPLQAVIGGSTDAFVTKLNRDGTELIFSTYLGGSAFDGGTGIAVDADRNAYVIGFTRSADFRTTPGAFQPNFRDPPPNPFTSGTFDAFVAKIAHDASPPQ